LSWLKSQATKTEMSKEEIQEVKISLPEHLVDIIVSHNEIATSIKDCERISFLTQIGGAISQLEKELHKANS
jgi:galactitol-specific phosphotransferase system IIB component